MQSVQSTFCKQYNAESIGLEDVQDLGVFWLEDVQYFKVNHVIECKKFES